MPSNAFVQNWDFKAGRPERWRQRMVIEALVRRGIRSPGFIPVQQVTPKPCWALYFVYTPDGHLNDAHRFTLQRLKDEGFAIFVIQATAKQGQVSEEIRRYADAVYWKALEGFDFSAYALGLRTLAHDSPGARVLVLNDSVVGPFVDLENKVKNASWDLTGFTACANMENHIQSYAFILRRIDPGVMRRLWTVLFPLLACGNRDDVILCQETRLARIASGSMSVGAYWFADQGDITQTMPFELMDAGYPFIKKSLVTTRSAFADKARVTDFINDRLGSRDWA